MASLDQIAAAIREWAWERDDAEDVLAGLDLLEILLEGLYYEWEPDSEDDEESEEEGDYAWYEDEEGE